MGASRTAALRLNSLYIDRFRSLSDVSLSLSARFNVLYGRNGAGKTSVLEAIHFLSQGRSFRSGRADHLIQYELPFFVVASVIERGSHSFRLGVRRSRSGVTEMKLDGNRLSRASQAAQELPVLTIHPGRFSLLTGPRQARRSFLDWGVFYRYSTFREVWQRYSNALRQRNAVLRQRRPIAEVSCWDPVLGEEGGKISRLRQEYLEQLEHHADAIAREFGFGPRLRFRFRQGWPESVALSTQLKNALDSDRKRGYTQYGPQRGGFEVMFDEHPIAAVASRGQIKLATLIVKLAQLKIVMEQGRGCVVLLDDIDSELDDAGFESVLHFLHSLEIQVIATTLNQQRYVSHLSKQAQLFHVEHGEIRSVDR